MNAIALALYWTMLAAWALAVIWMLSLILAIIGNRIPVANMLITITTGAVLWYCYPVAAADRDCIDDNRLRVAWAGGAPICLQLPAGQMPGLFMPVHRRQLSPWECDQPDIRCEYMTSSVYGACVKIAPADEFYALRYICQGKKS